MDELISRRHQNHQELRLMTERLIAEFAEAHPPGSIIRTVARSREALLRAGQRNGLVSAAERMTRDHLHARVPRAAAW